jgi:hypothetical protein
MKTPVADGNETGLPFKFSEDAIAQTLAFERATNRDKRITGASCRTLAHRAAHFGASSRGWARRCRSVVRGISHPVALWL